MPSSSPLWFSSLPFPPVSLVPSPRRSFLEEQWPASLRAAVSSVRRPTDSKVALAVWTAIMISAGATDVEVYSLVPPHLTGPVRANGVKLIASLCDQCRMRPSGQLVQITRVQLQPHSRWMDIDFDVVVGAAAGRSLRHAHSLAPVSEAPDRPWWLSSGWWRVFEACGVAWWPNATPTQDMLQQLVGHHARVVLHPAGRGDAARPVWRWLAKAINGKGTVDTGEKRGRRATEEEGEGQEEEGGKGTASPRSSAPTILALIPQAPVVPAPVTRLPQQPKLAWEPAFDAAFYAMTQRGLCVNLPEWDRRLAAFSIVLEAEVAAIAAGEVVRPRRKSPKTLLRLLTDFDAELRRRLDASPDGRVRAEWHQLSWSRRMTARGLALQSLPREMRPAIEPAAGNRFVIVDWRSCQPHILARLAGDGRMLADVTDDIYVVMSSMVWPDLPADREAGKYVALPLLFGARGPALAEKAAMAGRPIAPDEISTWFHDIEVAMCARWPQFWAWRQKQVRELRSWLSPLGYPIDPPVDEKGAHIVIPGLAQSIEADALRMAMMGATEALRGTCAKPVFVHHDALFFEVPRIFADKAAGGAARLMDRAMRHIGYDVPAKVTVCDRWPGKEIE